MTSRTLVGPQQLIKFEYDWQGRRIQKRVWNSTTETGPLVVDQRFVYDGWNLIATLNGASEITAAYTWGTDLSGTMQEAGGVGGLLFASVAGSQNYVAYDGNGNVSTLINTASGQISAQYEYAPFGEVIRATGPMAKANPFRFSTKYTDDESDLVYYGYRYYNPSTGRFISYDPAEDPAEELLDSQAEDSPSTEQPRPNANLYMMAWNEPIDSYDYLGLQASCCQNATPVDASVEAHDVARNPDGHRLSKGDTIGAMLVAIGSQVGSGKCPRSLTIGAHGNPGIMAIGGDDLTTSNPIRKGHVNQDQAINPQNASMVGDRLKKAVCFCKPCTIWLLSCNVALGADGQNIAAALAQSTGCTVMAANGYLIPNYENPGKSEIKPKTRRHPAYPGGGNQFISYGSN